MELRTIEDYYKEVERVDEALSKTLSDYLKNDYIKYRKKLLKEIRDYKKFKNQKINA